MERGISLRKTEKLINNERHDIMKYSIKRGYHMTTAVKKPVFIVLVLVLIATIFTCHIASAGSGRTVQGRIMSNDSVSGANNVTVIVHTTVFSACNCSTPISSISYTNVNGDYAISSANLVFDAYCGVGGQNQNDPCDGLWTDNDALWITIDGSTAIPSALPDGSTPYGRRYNWSYYYIGSPVFADVLNLSLDPAPIWSGNKTYPASGSQYGTPLQFNITWQDNIKVDDVLIEHNFTGSYANSSMSNVSSEFYFDLASLAVGSYSWKSFANDTYGHMNSSDRWLYEVVKAASSVNLLLDGSDANITIEVNQAVNIVGTLVSGQGSMKLYLGGSQMNEGSSPLSNLTNFTGIGTYNVTVVFDGNDNYTSSYETHFVEVIDNRSPYYTAVSVYPATPAAYLYGGNYQFNVTWHDDYMLGSVKIEHNFTGGIDNVTMSNVSDEYYFGISGLAAGTYYWKSHAADTSGNSNATDAYGYVVQKGTSVVNLLLDGTDANITVDVNSVVNITGYLVSGEGMVKLYHNGVLINSGLGPLENMTNFTNLGVYNITIVHESTQNYTSSYETHFVEVVDTVAPAYSSISTYPASPVVYVPGALYQFNVTWSDYQNNVVKIFQNFTGAEVQDSMYPYPTEDGPGYYFNYTGLGVGTYYWKSNATDLAGNSNETSVMAFVITQATPTCALAFHVPGPQIYGTGINASCSCTNTETPAVLYRNGSDVTTAENNKLITLAAGDYLYNCTTPATQNYTSASDSDVYTITKGTPVITLYLNHTDADFTGYLLDEINVSGTMSAGLGTLELYKNSTLMNSGDNYVENISVWDELGDYNMTLLFPGSQNHTAAQVTHILAIDMIDEPETNSTINVDNETIDIDWDDVPEAEEYIIYYTYDRCALDFLNVSAVPPGVYNVSGITDTNWTDSDAYDNLTKYYRVGAIRNGIIVLSNSTLGKQTFALLGEPTSTNDNVRKNWITVPFNLTYNAEGFLNEVPNSIRMRKLLRPSNSSYTYVTHNKGGPNDFAMEIGVGYEIEVSADSDFTVTGYSDCSASVYGLFGDPLTTNDHYRKNWVGYGFSHGITDAEGYLANMTHGIRMTKLDRLSNSTYTFVTHNLAGPNNYNLDIGVGYELEVSGDEVFVLT